MIGVAVQRLTCREWPKAAFTRLLHSATLFFCILKSQILTTGSPALLLRPEMVKVIVLPNLLSVILPTFTLNKLHHINSK